METVKTIHSKLRNELTDYIKSQYIGKNNLLLSALECQLDKHEVLWQTPYVELPASYEISNVGIDALNIPDWLKVFFRELTEQNLGVFKMPFTHQTDALQNAWDGKDLFVSTGTGSGKTECFMWPLIAKMCAEAKTSPELWKMRGTRAILMYPMNALVADQISRLRRIIGNDMFLEIFRSSTTEKSRRPQFGMYTGRTPYAGPETTATSDKELAKSLAHLLRNHNLPEDVYDTLLKEGKIPAKVNLDRFIENLKNGSHITDPDDAELITRFEMQNTCPDILITNYSMLEYMLLRPREANIWNTTKQWLSANDDNKLLFIIDEAHMYRGAAGGEVALLIRRLFHKLGITRDKVQFILTTASMPNSNEEDNAAVRLFARNLTSGIDDKFQYLFGKSAKPVNNEKYNLDTERFLHWKFDRMDNDETLLGNLNRFWNGIAPVFDSVNQSQIWLFENIKNYDKFNKLYDICSGTANSIDEIARKLFPDLPDEKATIACYNTLDMAAYAIGKNGEALFPVRLHMLFRGLRGLYACTNPQCKNAHSYDKISLGQIYLDDSVFTCPDCGSLVYELLNDRRCGTLFLKGYVSQTSEKTFLWRNSGLYCGESMREIHLFIPQKEKRYRGSEKYPISPCYLDTISGFLYFDDTIKNRDNTLKLYYSQYTEKGKPDIYTFTSCPHCRHLLSKAQLTTFSSKGNQSFFNLVKAQFNAQSPIPSKSDTGKYPNQGRKVLLFSDSRQRAARLALDMSQASDEMAVMQLFMLAIEKMEQQDDLSLNNLYGYFIREAAKRDIQLFHGESRNKYRDDCNATIEKRERRARRGKKFLPDLTFDNAPDMVKEHLLRLFCGAYNTLYDNALAWIEPTEESLEEAIDALEDHGINTDERKFIAVFNAWVMDIFTRYGALGHQIDDERRKQVLSTYGRLGLPQKWEFSNRLLSMLGGKKNQAEIEVWKKVFHDEFLDGADDRYYIQLTKIMVRDGLEHEWLKCKTCAELTAYSIEGKCSTCGSEEVEELTKQEYDALEFWRKPIIEARKGAKINVIDTEEHTAQLSHNDKRDNLWSRTEQYEMRFQDLLQEEETPVDILSCTTTMEVGIDIGSLTAVGLRNVPPMRENYQQRAGRAGRRGAGLSTIVTFCEDGAHDSNYFSDPTSMFRGDPRRPWLDVSSEKLLWRHMNLIILKSFLEDNKQESLDDIGTISFFDEKQKAVFQYIEQYSYYHDNVLLFECSSEFIREHKKQLVDYLEQLNQKRLNHPELFEGTFQGREKSLLDSLYEEGIIPTYSFPKNVVSVFINDVNGKTEYQADRGLDVAIAEYAPGRSIVLDKNTYQIGGLYFGGSEKQRKNGFAPAKAFMEDANYVKQIYKCEDENCAWFGFGNDLKNGNCPLCAKSVKEDKQMVRPWGFGPVNGKTMARVRINETYSYPESPEYSALPDSDDLKEITGFTYAKIAVRSNQRIIMRNNGDLKKGFMICPECGAAAPGEDNDAFKLVGGNVMDRPYRDSYAKFSCKHKNAVNHTIGFDFVTDMLVLEITLDPRKINTFSDSNPWLHRASASLAEALRLQTSMLLDIEFTELNSGFRWRKSGSMVQVDIYLYDNVSSGAGYSSGISSQIDELLKKTKSFLQGCKCDNACQNCLKHYRNQNHHNMLDRFSALDLLDWAENGSISHDIPIDEQWKMIDPLTMILKDYGIESTYGDAYLSVKNKYKATNVCVYPDMIVRPQKLGVLFISKFEIKYSRAYAVDSIKGALN